MVSVALNRLAYEPLFPGESRTRGPPAPSHQGVCARDAGDPLEAMVHWGLMGMRERATSIRRARKQCSR
jgi:hypothetical protein